ncbi:MAG: peptidoglycan DD-metalloendopeptidase family protein, partial [Candidatus Cloacimonetes bacterium]|nr:peptidoglycan DD-metalloendopeptidase family protein [Candidatus Cloacimonadota bacterium]
VYFIQDPDDGGVGLKYVDIQHSGSSIRSRYLHLNSISEDLSVGVQVSEGQLIGTAGTTGGVAAHLHFDIFSGDNRIHPLNVMPYSDHNFIQVQMIDDDCTNPSFEVFVPKNELDIRKLVIYTSSIPYGYGSDWSVDRQYIVDFDNTQFNVPVNDNQNWIVLDDTSTSYDSPLWKLYIEPDNLLPNASHQRIVYRLESCADYDDDLEEEMLRLEARIYTTGSTNHEAFMINYDFSDPVIIYEEVIPAVSYQLTNYPNPFSISGTNSRSAKTTISFYLPEASEAKIEIFNIRGQLVKTVCNKQFAEGYNNVFWTGKDNSSRATASGIYFYSLTVNGERKATKKLLMLE